MLLNLYVRFCQNIKHLEQHISPTQFGFREGRSTVDPLFCIRRLTDVCEQGNEKLSLVVLDWEKAFDKINHNKMFLPLERLNIPSDLLNAVKAIYNNPTFQVTHEDKFSTWLPQRTGIRQGCPLSPDLFILTTHAMFYDVLKRGTTTLVIPNRSKASIFHELLYADDTLIVAKSFASATKYLINEE